MHQQRIAFDYIYCIFLDLQQYYDVYGQCLHFVKQFYLEAMVLYVGVNSRVQHLAEATYILPRDRI